MAQLINMTGQRWGKWTILRLAPSNPERPEAIWLCRCECGTEQPVSGVRLRAGNSTQCRRCSYPPSVAVGDIFGSWTVLATAGRYRAFGNASHRMYSCRCQCGLVKEVRGSNLTRGIAKSCAPCGRKARKQEKK